MKIKLNNTPIKGFRFKAKQPESYNTFVGHPFIAHDMSYRVPADEAESEYNIASRGYPLIGEYDSDESRRIIVRLPTSPSLRGRPADILGDILWLLGSEGPDIEALYGSSRIKDKSKISKQKLIYGLESFPAKRWAIRINNLAVRSPSFSSEGTYLSKELRSDSPIKAVWLDIYGLNLPEECETHFFIKIAGIEEPYRIFPRNKADFTTTGHKIHSPYLPPNTDPGAEQNNITRYVFDPMKDIGPHARYIETETPVYSINLAIYLRGPGSATPTLSGYTLFAET